MFDSREFIENKVKELREQVRDKAIIACSGGVDSTVAAVLASKAIGDKLLAVYVDTGLMRKNESKEVKTILQNTGVNFRIMDASKEFFEALEGIIDPEEKRRVIGEKFVRIFERIARKEKAKYLVQGTIAPDWIESGGGLRDTIKLHHNVGALPQRMEIKLVEPLRDLYKDEVREVARVLGIRVAERQPFPGPALAIRVIGKVTLESVEIAREANAIMEEEIEKAVEEGKMECPWQYFAVLLPVKSVGVHGDVRAYGYTIAIRAVQSIDGMTADYSKLPHDVLEKISTRITNKLKDKVNRIVYDITNKPPGTIEWE